MMGRLVQDIRAAIKGLRVAELAGELVKIPSVTGSEGELAGFVAEWCRRSQVGLDVHRDEVRPGRSNVVVCRKFGNGGRRVLLNGHLDTVPPGGGWTRDPFGGEVAGGFLYGRGAADMKGGLAAGLAAVVGICRAGVESLLCGEITFAAVVGEEEDQCGTRHLLETGFRSDCAVVLEPTQLAVVNAHKGAVNVEFVVRGKAAHASTPWAGCNAIYRAARLVAALEAHALRLAGQSGHMVLGSPSLVVGTIHGGEVPYMVPDRCVVTVDRRTLPGETAGQVIAELEDVLRRTFGDAWKDAVTVRCLVDAPAMETPAESSIVLVLRRATGVVLGHEAPVRGWPAVSDANLLVQSGIPTVLFGPGDIAMAHKADESVRVAELEAAAEVLAVALVDLLTPGQGRW